MRRRRAPWVLAALLAVVLAATQLPGLAQSASDDPLPTVVFVARADNPVDALAAGAVGGTMGAQVLLTRTSTLEDTTRQALIDLAPDLVVLAGGTAALSPAVEAAIQAIPLDTRRVSGATRVETAAALSELAAELGFGRPILTGATVAGDAGLTGTMSVGALEVLSDDLVANLNADMLDGFSANELVRASSASDTEFIDDFASAAFTPILEHAVQVPVDGVLLVWGSVAAIRDFDGPAQAKLTVRVTVNGDVAAQPMSMFLQDSGVQESSATPTGAIPVTAGTASVDIEARTPQGLAFIAERQITTLFVPFGDSGDQGTLSFLDLTDSSPATSGINE